MMENLNIETIKENLLGSEILSISGFLKTETVVFKKNDKIFSLNYRLEEGKKVFLGLTTVSLSCSELKNLQYYRNKEGLEIETNVTPEGFMEYLESGKFLSSKYFSSDDDGQFNYHFATIRNVAEEIIKEKKLEAVKKVTEKVAILSKEEMDCDNVRFKFGISDSSLFRGRIHKVAVQRLIELMGKDRPSWIRYSPNAYDRHGAFFLDNGRYYSKFDPNLPVGVRAGIFCLDDTEFILYLVSVLEQRH